MFRTTVAFPKTEYPDQSLIQFWKNQDEYGLVRSLHPIPLEIETYYFEVKVLDVNDNPVHMEVGLTSRHFSFQETLGQYKHAFLDNKWVPNSFGYSSKGIIHGSYNQETYHKKQEYSRGDTIGCYVDTVKSVCYFTKNGVYLKKLLRLPTTSDSLVPTIAFSTNETIVHSFFGCKKIELDFEGKG